LVAMWLKGRPEPGEPGIGQLIPLYGAVARKP
jgi:hypothetical protein